MAFSKMRSRFSRSRESSSSADLLSHNGDTLSSTTGGQRRFSTSPSDMSEKILSSTEPWPTPRRTPVSTLFESSLPSPPTPRSSSQSHYSPPESVAPACTRCGHLCTRHITRSSNRNGNAGRPYYKCSPCDKFVRFDDDRGLDKGNQGNPHCDCGRSSRRQLTSREKGRRIFYACASGSCDFFEWYRNEDGSEWSVAENVADALGRLRVI